jgi:polar amino acid transport system substrate-binding protein
VFQAGPEGIEIPKGNQGMDKALEAAMTKLISSGMYQKILSNWGVASGAITQSQLEPPGSGSGS